MLDRPASSHARPPGDVQRQRAEDRPVRRQLLVGPLRHPGAGALVGELAGLPRARPHGRRRRHRLPAADRPLEGLRRRHRSARRVARDHHLGDRPARRDLRASPCSAPCTRRCSIRSSPPSRSSPPTTSAQGRFGLNIVAGWNEGEFEMFGVQQREHEARYAYAQEWIDAIKLAWGPEEDFDFDGEHIKLKKVRAKPKPYGGTRPLIMNAGSSGAGPGLRDAQLRRLLHRHLDLAPGRRCDRRRWSQDVKGEARAHRPRDRGLHRRPGDLPPDAEGGRGLLPLRHHRDGRLGLGRPHDGDQEHHAADASARRPMPRSASISPRARSAAIRSSARPTASPRSLPI